MPHIKNSAKNANVMRLLLTLTLLVFFCLNSDAQKRKKLKLIEAKWDETINAPVIPNNIFALNADGLVMSRSYRSKNKIISQTTFQIFWPSPYGDGDSLFIITGKQIILTEGHNNPNPDYLHWFAAINKKQHEAIVHNIETNINSFSEYKLPSEEYVRQLNCKYFIPEKKKSSYKDSEYKRYLNAKKLMEIFNKGMPPKDKIIFPDWKKFRKQPPLITAGRADEIDGFIVKY